MTNPISGQSQSSSPLFDKTSWSNLSYREAFASSGILRPYWQPLVSEFRARGEQALADDHEKAIRMRHDDGATINPFEDLTRQASPWELDIFPLPIAPQEWSALEKGLIQRVTILEKLLADVYGNQELLNSGTIPPEMIHANPNFLHPCHGITPSNNRYLTFYAADLYRTEDGSFRVLRDYGGHPQGLGYALENRIVMSRLYPKLYHRSWIRRLAPFFHVFHKAMSQRVSTGRGEPDIALLSPGPDHPLYFEHALLSRYLGYPLVEGQDLTVRNGEVYQKKLAGLEPVEALFRQIDDLDSDPFTLRRATPYGVAGLIQVCRDQNIDVTNPIGSGFIDTPALRLFMDDLSRQLLNEELQLSSHDGWWCNTEEGYQRALANNSPICPALDQSLQIDNQDLLSLVNETPHKYMVSASVDPSLAPSWQGRQIGSSRVIMRFFVCATAEGFAVMPGGLAITSTDINSLLTGSPENQQSKDIWVLSEGPVEPFTLMDSFNTIPQIRRSSDLPSRAADNLIWLGRYLERTEGLIRVLRPVYRRLSSEDRIEEMPELNFLLTTLKNLHILQLNEDDPIDDARLEEHLHQVLYDKNSNNSVITLVQKVRYTARNVRDRLSLDSFRIINRLEQFNANRGQDPLDQLDHTLYTLSGFSGMAMESMTRGLGWRFMDMGRRIERGINLAGLVHQALPHLCGDPREQLYALLEVSDSLMTYRARYRSSFQLEPVLDLLLKDESNPKSLAFQLMELAEHVENLPRSEELKFSRSEERLALEMLTSVRLLDLSTAKCDNGEKSNSLTEFLHHMEQLLQEFSQQVTAHYLSRVPTTPHFCVLDKHNDL